MGFFCLEMCLYLCGWPRAAFGVEGTGLFLPEADIYIEWGRGGEEEDWLTLATATNSVSCFQLVMV